MSKAIIIGSGIAGIAAAIRLCAKGYEVDVFEANPYPGGKLTEFSENGFRFDAGPSLFTMPQLIEELFLLHNENPSDHFKYIKLGTGCHYFYEDGTAFKSETDIGTFAETVGKAFGEKPEHILRFFSKSAQLYKITAPVFLEKSLHKARTYFSKTGLYGIINLWRLNSFTSMNRMNSKRFSDRRTIQFFNRFATYNGSNPYQAPATLNIIPHLEFGFGTYFPLLGMASITNSLVDLAKRHGVRFHFNRKVTGIQVKDGITIGVKAEGDIVLADKVICNMDVYLAFKYLMPEIRMPKRVRNVEPSSSAVIFYWGISKEFGQLGLHNIFFAEDYKAEFEAIFTGRKIHSDPTVYVNITSKLKSDDAPIGCENWFVMVNAPSDSGQDWDRMILSAKSAIINKLNRLLNVDLSGMIISESILDPRSIEIRTSSYRGALYGSSSNSKWSAFFRHPNFSSRIRNLYFCGGSVHPGGGLPLCLLSAKIAVEMVDKG